MVPLCDGPGSPQFKPPEKDRRGFVESCSRNGTDWTDWTEGAG